MLDTAQPSVQQRVLFYICCRREGLNKRAGSLPSPLPHTGWLFSITKANGVKNSL